MRLQHTTESAILGPFEAGSIPEPGRGAAWIARLTGGQKVAGSNPVAPTYKAFRNNALRRAFLLGGLANSCGAALVQHLNFFSPQGVQSFGLLDRHFSSR